MSIRTILLAALAFSLAACQSTKKIQVAVSPKTAKGVVDTIATVEAKQKEDSTRYIQETVKKIKSSYIDFKTFSGKMDVDYADGSGKKYNVTAHVRMLKDSIIWISIRAILNIEGLRAYITKDSVKIINRQDDTYTARSVSYLQEVTSLPLTLSSLQDLFLGNAVFLDSNVVSYSETNDAITLLSINEFFKNLLTVNKTTKRSISSKLDDVDDLRNRTCYLRYSGYEDKKGVNFSTDRQITVTEKKKLDIKLDFKQYEFNETLSFPFPFPKNR